MDKDSLIRRFRSTRNASLTMCVPLGPEHYRIQPAAEVSPPWWNLAHTSWFFARNILQPFGGKKTKEDEIFDYVLNSYYVALGPRLERSRRGLMTRPTVEEVYKYRHSVDERLEDLVKSLDKDQWQKCSPILEIGINHEQQHQELFYSEIKYILYQNPPQLRQNYLKAAKKKNVVTAPKAFLTFEEGIHTFGNVEEGWGWDNEYPLHKFYIHPFSLQNTLVTNGEFLEFIDAGGYSNQLLWLDNGWTKLMEAHWESPLYWEKIGKEWYQWTLHGLQKLDMQEPVCHVSFYEAEAYAGWKNARLPAEREWELAARTLKASTQEGNFLDSGLLHPSSSLGHQFMGDVWEWTNSYYEPYPGYHPFSGALSEYNEKFMDNQRVMRGGSCVSERNHLRLSYRNFWPPETRFQFTGIRLAQ